MYDVCFWCKLDITDGREESGSTHPTIPDWMNDGDFGCDENPISGEDGVGSHNTLEEIKAMVRYLNTDEAYPGFLKAMEGLYGKSAAGRGKG